MLREIRSDAVTNSGAPLKKIWFHSAEGDLYVWKDPAGGIVSFQLTCFDQTSGERRELWAQWEEGKKVKIGLVDSKESDGRTHDLRSPVVRVSSADKSDVLRRLTDFVEREGGQLLTDDGEFLRSRLAGPS